jgi:hypothetical protein
MENPRGFTLIMQRAWNSSTLMTWASQFARVGTLLFVLPLILNRFTAAEVAVWYLFAGVISLGAMADFGFRSTFVRLIAYAAGGATEIGVMSGVAARGAASTNWELVEKLNSAMLRVYGTTTAVVVFALIVGGSISLYRPISQVSQPGDAWVAWGVICATSAVEFRGKLYKNYLEGMFQIALVRRVETFFRAAAILSTLAVMSLAPSLLNLVLLSRFWVLANVLRDRYLARAVFDGRYRTFQRVPYDSRFIGQVWSPAWRSGLSTLMARGFLAMTGILYAQIGTPGAVASYLLALKLMTAVRDVCNAPFYSKIPLMGRLRAEGNLVSLVAVASRGMRLANVTFLLGVVGIGLASQPLLQAIGSSTAFVPLTLWWLISLGFFGHRLSSFFMDLYLTTNHVISHIVDGISGAVFGIAALVLFRPLQVYAFPIAMIVAFAGLHVSISATYAMRSIGLRWTTFARQFLVFPTAMIVLLAALVFVSLQN